ncbi:MAG: hypothetical protein C4343_03365 [Chloroflexota bacterium]
MPPSRHRGAALGPTIAALFLVALALRPPIVGIGPLLPAIERSLAIGHGPAGLLGAIPVLCMGIFAPLGSWLARRVGPERAIALAVGAVAGFGFLRAIAPNAPAVMATTFAIGVGIGLFILFIGMYQGGFVRVPVPLGQPLTAPPSVPLELGNFATLPFLVALIGLLLGIALLARGVPGALLISILGTTLIAMVIRYGTGAQVSTVPGKAEWPAQPLSFPDFSTFGAGLNIDVFFHVGVITAIVTIFSIMLSDFFDTMGTVIGIGSEAGWTSRDGCRGSIGCS